MQLTFVAAAIALAATASAGVVERRITHKCIAEKDATIQFTGPNSPSGRVIPPGGCESFTRLCSQRHPDKVHVTDCKGKDFVKATCTIDFGDKKVSYARKIARKLKWHELYPATSKDPTACDYVDPTLCVKRKFTKRKQLICPSNMDTM